MKKYCVLLFSLTKLRIHAKIRINIVLKEALPVLLLDLGI